MFYNGWNEKQQNKQLFTLNLIWILLKKKNKATGVIFWQLFDSAHIWFDEMHAPIWVMSKRGQTDGRFLQKEKKKSWLV